MHVNKVIFSFLLIIACFINFTIAQESKSQVRYEVEVKSVNESVSQIQVSFNARFYNDSDKDIAIPIWGRINYNDVFRFEIIGPDGQPLVGPFPERFSEPITSLLIERRSIPTIGNSPFVMVKAKDMVECNFAFQPTEVVNVQSWYFPNPGQYTLTAEFVNTHSSYVDPDTHEVLKMDNAFIGIVKSAPVKFTVKRNAAEGGYEIYNSNRRSGTPGMLVLGGNPGGQGALTISGTIVDEQGKPISDAVVKITANKDSGMGGPGNAGDVGDGIIRKTIDRQKSNSDGKFTFDNIPPDADIYALEAKHQGNFIMASMEIPLEKATSNPEIKMVMKKGIEMSGKVVDKDGNALAGTRIIVRGPGERTVYTDEDGTFQFSGAERADCHVACAGFKPRSDVKPDAGHENDGTWVIVLEER